MNPTAPPDPPFSPENLARNLRALAAKDPGLCERIEWPVDGSQVRFVEGGRPLHVQHRDPVPLEPDDAALDELFAPVADSDAVLLLGLGTGVVLAPQLRRDLRVVAWERDPWLLRLTLMRLDVSDALRSGRLRLALGTDLLDVDPAGLQRVEHPYLGRRYRRELAFRDEPGRRRALLVDGGLFVEQLGDALVRAGFSPWTSDARRLSLGELSHVGRRLAPEILVAVNYVDGMAEYASDLGVPLLCWEVDPSSSPPRPATGPTDHVWIFTYRQALAGTWRAAGYANATYMPLAADTEVRNVIEFTAEKRAQYAAPISFVGASMLENAERLQRHFLELHQKWRGGSGFQEEGRALLTAVLGEQRQHTARFVLPEALEERAPGFRAWADAQPGHEDPALLAGEVVASEKRLTTVANLGELGVHVWGDRGWSRLTEHGVNWRGPAGHQREITRIYNASTVNLDVGRVYQCDMVTMRVFDVLACAGFLLAEHGDELCELFEPGRELDTWHDIGELKLKAQRWIDRPDDARVIGERGRKRVREEHTIDLRLRQMLTQMGLR
jgi:spore maturation protein CgeB